MSQRRGLALVAGALFIVAACGGTADVAAPTTGPVPLVATPGANATPSASTAPVGQATTAPATPHTTAHATPRATATSPTSLPVSITSLPATPRGHQAKATIKTAGGAHCTIEVDYASGPSKASGLGPKIAAVSGILLWSWKVGSNTTVGDWPVIVDCSKGSLSGEATGSLRVT